MTLQSSLDHAPSSASIARLRVRGGMYLSASLEVFPALLHGISTRTAPDGQDWNLSARRGSPMHPPDPVVALENRHKLARALGTSLDRMVGCQQVHGSEVVLVTDADAGRGMKPDLPSMQGADAMVTSAPGLALLALSADCFPVFFYDPAHQAIGIAHSGWKGTADRISSNVVTTMGKYFDSEPGNLKVVIGPGIGPCCYSVGEEVVERVENSFAGSWEQLADFAPLLRLEDEKVYFNLPLAIRRALLDAGVRAENISDEAVCTAHNLDTFYSHRGEKGQCGLFGAVLGIR